MARSSQSLRGQPPLPHACSPCATLAGDVQHARGSSLDKPPPRCPPPHRIRRRVPGAAGGSPSCRWKLQGDTRARCRAASVALFGCDTQAALTARRIYSFSSSVSFITHGVIRGQNAAPPSPDVTLPPRFCPQRSGPPHPTPVSPLQPLLSPLDSFDRQLVIKVFDRRSLTPSPAARRAAPGYRAAWPLLGGAYPETVNYDL